MILSFRTDMPGQTVCHSVCIIWTHYSMVEPHSSNFRVITTIFFGCPNIYEIYGSLSTLKFPWDRSRSTMLSQKGDLLATKRLFWAGKVYRSIPTTLFLKKKLHHANFHANKNLLPCIKTCLISNQTIWELLFIRSACTCINSSNHVRFLSFYVKTVYNRSRLSPDWLTQLNYFPCTYKLCTLMPSTMVDLTN